MKISAKLPTLQEWRQKIDEIGGGGMATIVSKKDCNNADYQVQGAVCGVPGTKSEKGARKMKKK